MTSAGFVQVQPSVIFQNIIKTIEQEIADILGRRESF
jgi:hypothetical protein